MNNKELEELDNEPSVEGGLIKNSALWAIVITIGSIFGIPAGIAIALFFIYHFLI